MKLSCKATQVVEVPPHAQAKATRGRGCRVISKVARSIKQCLPCTRVSRITSVPAGSRPGAKQQSQLSVDAGQSLAALCHNKSRLGAKQLLTPDSVTEQHEELLQVLEDQATAALTENARHTERHKQRLLLQEQRHLLNLTQARQQLKDLQASHDQSVRESQHQHELLLSKLQLDLQEQLKEEQAGHVDALAELQVQLADLRDCLQSERQQSFKVPFPLSSYSAL